MPSIFSCCFSSNVVAPNSPAAGADGAAAEPASKAEFTSVNPDEKGSSEAATAAAETQTTSTEVTAETKPILYGNAGSTCVQRVRFTAFEKGVELDFRNLDWPESKSAQYLQRQPLGKFPAMEHESLNFHESRAICMYLEERYKGRGTTLVPEGLKPHTTFNQWLSIESTEVLPSIYEILSQRIWGTWRGLTPNEEVIAKSVTSAQAGLDYLETQLTGKEYILGDFSLIDIFFAPYIKLLMTLPEKTLIESRPNVLAWWQRVSARPGFAASQPPAQ